jgi:hypothetical protein
MFGLRRDRAADLEALAASTNAAGLEHGFAALRLRADVVALARARLVLLEERAHGRLPPSPEFYARRLHDIDAALARAATADGVEPTATPAAVGGMAGFLTPNEPGSGGEHFSSAAVAVTAAAAVVALLSQRARQRGRELVLHARRGVTSHRLCRAEQRHHQARAWVARREALIVAGYDIAYGRGARALEMQSHIPPQEVGPC